MWVRFIVCALSLCLWLRGYFFVGLLRGSYFAWICDNSLHDVCNSL